MAVLPPAALSLKKRWQEFREKQGKDTAKPNLVMGAQGEYALVSRVPGNLLHVQVESSARRDGTTPWQRGHGVSWPSCAALYGQVLSREDLSPLHSCLLQCTCAGRR